MFIEQFKNDRVEVLNLLRGTADGCRTIIRLLLQWRLKDRATSSGQAKRYRL